MFDQSKYFSYNGGNRKGGMSLDHEVYVEAEVEMPAGGEEQIRRSGRESYIQETEINGFGVHVTVGKKKARLAFENLLRGLFRFIQNFCLYKADIFSPYSIKYVECRRNTHFRH